MEIEAVGIQAVAIGGLVLIFVSAFCLALVMGHAVEQRKRNFDRGCDRSGCGDCGGDTSNRTMTNGCKICSGSSDCDSGECRAACHRCSADRVGAVNA